MPFKASCTPQQIIEVVRGALGLPLSSPTGDAQIAVARTGKKPRKKRSGGQRLDTLFLSEPETFVESLPGTSPLFARCFKEQSEDEAARLNLFAICAAVSA
jgi:hypothetical protein